MNFGENLCNIKRNQGTETFRDNNIKVSRFVHVEIVSHLAQHLFFPGKKLAKQIVLVIGK